MKYVNSLIIKKCIVGTLHSISSIAASPGGSVPTMHYLMVRQLGYFMWEV